MPSLCRGVTVFAAALLLQAAQLLIEATPAGAGTTSTAFSVGIRIVPRGTDAQPQPADRPKAKKPDLKVERPRAP